MRDIEFILEKYEYTAGDMVQGQMIVICDKSYEYNRIHLTLEGKEHTRIVRSSGKHSAVYTDERYHYERRLDFQEAGEMQTGEHVYPFSFQIPKDAPSSYSGRSGWMDYKLKAKVEISWAIDPKEQAIITVKGPLVSTTSEGRSLSTEKDGVIVLEVDLERDVLCLGDELKFRVRVARDVEIR
ncbi:MAG: sporulation protein, partial [Candidatus Thorarchaeota archaeon]